MVQALEVQEPAATVHALVEDAWKAGLVSFELEGGTRSQFAPRRLRGFARGVRSFARGLIATRPVPPTDVLFFTLGDALANGGSDTYFGDLALTLGRRCKVLTVYAAPGKRLRMRSSVAVAPIEAFLRVRDALGVYIASKPPKAADEGDVNVLTAYLRAREHAAGEVVMLHVMAQAFERMFAQLKPETVVYPFENRTWEKRLLRAARRHGVSRCIGYQHTSITPRHLAFSDPAGLAGVNDLPDLILTCGEATSVLIKTQMPRARSRVAVGAALRAKRIDVAPPSKWGLLAPISSSRAEAWEILRVLHEFADASDLPVIVRTHPTIPIEDLYAQFSWPAHVRLSDGGPLSRDFGETTFVTYSSSTVALEGMLYGRLPVYLDIGDVPSGNPLHGDHAFVFRASTGRELALTVARIRGFTVEQLTSLREEAQSYAESYLIEPTPANVDRMATLIAPPLKEGST